MAFDLSGFRAYPERSFLLDRLQVSEAARERDKPTGSKGATNHFFRARWRARIDRLMARAGLPGLRSSSNNYREPHFHFDPSFETLGPQTNLFGYFQSERYFSSIAEKIRSSFEPLEPFGAAAQAAAGKIAESALPVSIHVRRGDYVQPATGAIHGVLDETYYRKALAHIEDRVGRSPDLFVFSDDLDAAAQVLHFVPPARVSYIQGDPDRPWEDMMLIARCRHHLIANSSFSWWGAWLNQSREKIVIAPRAWFTQKGLLTRNIRDLYPLGWIQL